MGGDRKDDHGTTSPLGLHYHSGLTPAGRLIEPGVPAVDAIVAKVNALLDESASREILAVALERWQTSMDQPTSRPARLSPRRLLSRKQDR